ncbi:hypothetical protein [Clostridium tyrobutyricum]|uniref:hypothetical protein n=1 Tax=Clostridium tyrobutyricum TaxID=1519 RepID=UPI0005808253|nr:hypothetical protein [Clostridium tyrobutyricum]
MKIKSKDNVKKSKQGSISILLYVAAVVVALIGVALLVNNVLLFKNTVAQYVGQGYSAATVQKQLIPSQLLPGIFEPVGLYGGIAVCLLAAGIINKKVSKCLGALTKDKCEESTEQTDNIEEPSKS